MAGPGGGPPRRSHTKSRKGCETCKRRHIRCDENFPQCRNCTKHKIRCPYNDMPATDERSASPEKPDLAWSPDNEARVEQWRVTNIFPFPGLRIHPAPDGQSLTREELRLIDHIASIYQQFDAMNASEYTIWTRQIPTIIQIGASHRYVLDALLAFSAMHISYMNKCPVVGNMVLEYRGRALQGLLDAIGSFNGQTSDAVLAASLVLSWQAQDWGSWTQHMQGTATVINLIREDRFNSQFQAFIDESSTFPTAPPSPTQGQRSSQPRKEDLDALEKSFGPLQDLEAYLKHNGEDTTYLVRLIQFLRGVRKLGNSTVEQQFDHLQPLRMWVLWLPVTLLQQTFVSQGTLVTIAYFYTAAMLMERLFPDIGAAYFGSLTMAPMDAITQRLLCIPQNEHYFGGEQMSSMVNPMLTFMEFPFEVLTEFRARMGLRIPFPGYQSFQTEFYTPEQSPSGFMDLSTTATEYPQFVYAGTPAFTYSAEDVSSTMGGDVGPHSATSPLQLSPHPNQLLALPSPSWAGHSPTSSNYGDCDAHSATAYSDNDDWCTSEMDFSGVVGGSSNFGVGGFVPQFQSAVYI